MATTAAETRELLDELKKGRVRFLLLQFTDLLGVNKAVEVPASRFEQALAGEVLFDGSALEGFARVEEADALLVPDLASFRVFPWEGAAGHAGDGEAGGAVARLICDIRYPDGRPFEGCPRTTLKRQLELRSEEHTSELQSRRELVCRLLLEKKKKKSAIVPSAKKETKKDRKSK